MQVLLIEPSYRNKYPPLGLMKISTFHKMREDSVFFVKGLDPAKAAKVWDRIYIATIFSFYWDKIIETINYYKPCVKDQKDFFVGGSMATIMAEELQKETGIIPVKGLLDQPGKLNIDGDGEIDRLPPDYKILEEVSYVYPANDAYLVHATRGCIRKCSFCAVHKIEPNYVEFMSVNDQITEIKEKYGEKKDLLVLDNNILASGKFDEIIDEIKLAGFAKGAKFGKKNRYVDFNQGIDLRLLTKKKLGKLSELAVRPLRIAFDHVSLKDQYIQKIAWAAEYGLTHLSNYILFNFKDTPEDFYERLEINVTLNEKLGTQIFSFPMRYIPINAKNRKFVGQHWNAKYLRGIQCILNATHGVVGPRKKFFYKAFGKDIMHFKRLLLMPEDYIIYRERYADLAADWDLKYSKLSPSEKEAFNMILSVQGWKNEIPSDNPKIANLLKHYA